MEVTLLRLRVLMFRIQVWFLVRFGKPMTPREREQALTKMRWHGY
jgi:hypothetical protein